MSIVISFVNLSLIALAHAAPGAAPAAQSASTQINSLWAFVIKGGPVMIPIGLCSLVAMTVVIERLITLRRRRVIPPGFLPGLRALLNNGADDRVQEALNYCRSRPSAIAHVFTAAIKRLGESEDRMEKHIQEAGAREVIKLRKHLRVLSVIGSVAPLLGLLGTITGMITAFQTVAASGEALGRTELLAKGIYEAMITTAAGLIVAIPVLICYHWLSAKIDSLIMHIDSMTVEFVEEFGPTTSRAAREGLGGSRVSEVKMPNGQLGKSPVDSVSAATA